jgi:hypothetical protein
MRRLLPLLGATLLAACASTPPPPGTQADSARLAAAAVPGVATRASVQAALGPTHKVAFDSGAQVWLYQVPRGGGRFDEFVILFDRAGVVHKTRQRPAPPAK